MTKPEWCPADVWEAAVRVELSLIRAGSNEETMDIIASAIFAERERCRGVANERAAQLWAVIQLPSTDETKAGWAGQTIEALQIEQRISLGHQPKQSIDIEGLHKAAEEAGFKHAN